MVQSVKINGNSTYARGLQNEASERGAGAKALVALRRLIQDGTLPAGESLPAERVLAERLQVNRGTLRSAIMTLTEEGVLNADLLRRRTVVSAPVQDHVMQNTIVAITVNPTGADGQTFAGGEDMLIDQGVIDGVRGGGYHLLGLNPDKLDKRQWSSLLDRSPRGVIVTDFRHNTLRAVELAELATERGIPVVVYGDEPDQRRFNRVVSDHELGGRLLTKWLIERGRRCILMTSSSTAQFDWVKRRYAGYSGAMKECDLAPLPILNFPPNVSPVDRTQDFELTRRIIAGYLVELFAACPQVDAVILPTDGIVSPFASALELCGRKSPKDIEIVGYDNIWRMRFYGDLEKTRPLATIDKQNHLIGVELLRLLLESVETREQGLPVVRKIPPQLIVVDAGQ